MSRPNEPYATSALEPGRQDWSTWPQYEASANGLPGRYWYPVMWSVALGSKPVSIEVTNRKVVLVRDGRTVHALHDRCPHRGVPLSLGKSGVPRDAVVPLSRLDLRPGVRTTVRCDHRRP